METFWRELWKDIDSWLEAGEQLIVCGDWNSNVEDDEFQTEFKKRSLIPAITRRHPNAPETYNNGSKPIDEIFVSETLEIASCGYMAHGIINSDHRPIWIEVTKESALGSHPPPTHQFLARKLKTNDPRIVKKYNHILQEEFEKYNLYKRCFDLYNTYSPTLTSAQKEEYTKLDLV